MNAAILNPYRILTWAKIDMTTDNNLAGTYTRVGTTVTVTATAHGLQVGHKQFIDFTTGLATDGIYTVVSVPDANTITITHPVSGATSGNCNLLRFTVMNSGNVANASKSNTVIDAAGAVDAGSMVVNLINTMPTNYGYLSGCGTGNGQSLWVYDGTFANSGANGFGSNWIRFFHSSIAGAGASNAIVSFALVG